MDHDEVNHPSHYTKNGSIECIEAIQASMDLEDFRGYCKGNILKYLWRYESKNNPQQDLAKAEWYLKALQQTFGNVKPTTHDDLLRTP